MRSVAVLATGTGVAHALTMAASPLLTRLYAPEAFGMLAVFVAVVTSLAPASMGKYEVALVVPDCDEESGRLLRAALLCCVSVSTLLFLLLAVAQDALLRALEAPSLRGWILLSPLVLLLLGVVSVTRAQANRLADYGAMARGRLVQSAACVAIQLCLGFWAAGFVGLLAGHVLGFLAGAVYMAWSVWRHMPSGVMRWGADEAAAMNRYRSYPLYNASTALLNGFKANVPVFFLAAHFPEAVVGYYALMLRVANAPTAFMASSISQVNLKKTVDLVNSGGRVVPHVHRLGLALLSVGAIPVVISVLWAPELFSVIFGEEWVEAGRYARIIAPAVGAQFVVSALSTTLGATENNHLGGAWNVVAFTSTVAVFAWFARLGDVYTLLVASLANDVVLSIFYYVLIVMAAHKPRNQLAVAK